MIHERPAITQEPKTQPMRDTPTKPEIDVGFIRLLFRSPDEERIAHRWAKRLSLLLGQKAMELRPDTTLSEMLGWAATAGVDSMDFVVVFEPELGLEFAEFLDYSDYATFREMVEHHAKQSGPLA